MKILIVEDEPLIAMHIELMVVDFGYHVCGIAASAQEAISRGVRAPSYCTHGHPFGRR